MYRIFSLPSGSRALLYDTSGPSTTLRSIIKDDELSATSSHQHYYETHMHFFICLDKYIEQCYMNEKLTRFFKFSHSHIWSIFKTDEISQNCRTSVVYRLHFIRSSYWLSENFPFHIDQLQLYLLTSIGRFHATTLRIIICVLI